MRFCDVLQAVRLWLGTAVCRQGNGIEIVRCDEGGLRVLFESADNMGELVVAEADFVPYRFVSFQILRTDETPVFCYYDADTSIIPEILENLDAGLRML